MAKGFSEKQAECKKMASESLMFTIVYEDLAKFMESVDRLEENPEMENLLNSMILFFSEEKIVLIDSVLQAKKSA